MPIYFIAVCDIRKDMADDDRMCFFQGRIELDRSKMTSQDKLNRREILQGRKDNAEHEGALKAEASKAG